MIFKSKSSLTIADQDASPVLSLSTKSGSFTEASDFLAVSATNGAILNRRDAQALHAWLGKALAK